MYRNNTEQNLGGEEGAGVVNSMGTASSMRGSHADWHRMSGKKCRETHACLRGN